MHTPQVGDTITYVAFGGFRRTVLVDTAEEDIKNGRPGFAGIVTAGDEKGSGVWGYNDQITHVTKGSRETRPARRLTGAEVAEAVRAMRPEAAAELARKVRGR